MLWVCALKDTKAESLDASSAANTLRSSATELRGRRQCTFSLANQRHIAGSLPMLLSPVERMLTQRVPQISHGRNPRANPSPHAGGTPSVLAERRLKTTVVEDRGPIS